MGTSVDESETFKLSEIVIENDEILSDVNNLISELKNFKEIDQSTYDTFITKCKDSLLDLDDIMEVIDSCEKKDDLSLKSFDAVKKSSKAKSEKSKKLLEENMQKLEKLLQKSLAKGNSKKKDESKTDVTTNGKKDDAKTEKPKVENKKVKEEASKDKREKDEIESNVKVSDESKSGSKKIKEKKKNSEIEKSSDDKNEEESEKEKTSGKSNNKNKGILKSSKNKSKFKDEKENKTDKDHTQEIKDSTLKDIEDEMDDSIPKSIPDIQEIHSVDDENIKRKAKKIKNEKDESSTMGEEDKSNNKKKDKKDKSNKDKKKKEKKKKEKKLDKENKSDSVEEEKNDDEIRSLDKISEKSQKIEEITKEGKKEKKKEKEKDLESKVKIDKKTKDKNQESPVIQKKTKPTDDQSKTDDKSIVEKIKKDIDDDYSEIEENLSSDVDQKGTDKIVSEKIVHTQYQSPPSANLQLQVEKKTNKLCTIIKNFKGEEDDDLTVVKGEEVTLIEITEDDFCYAQNSKGKIGYFPISCIKLDNEKDNQTTKVANENIPVNNPEDTEGTALWDQIKKSMQDKGITELLKSLGNLPSGFRYSTLATWSQENSNKSDYIAYLFPKLSDSHLSYCDLPFDQIETTKFFCYNVNSCMKEDANQIVGDFSHHIRPQEVRMQRQVQIVKLSSLPLINEKFVIKSRHVRICLFDGTKAVSNIHLIRASVNEKDTKTWNFNSKISDATKSLDYNEIFLRFNSTSFDFTMLMEFCIIGYKSKLNTSNTIPKVEESFTDDELIELSIGWTTVPLYETNGQPINNKKADYIIHGGTPFEKGLEVDSDSNKPDKGSKLKSLMNTNKHPVVTIRIYLPTKENKELLETLPSMIIGSNLNLESLSFYRRILAKEVLECRNDLTSAKPVYSPFLVSFTQAAKYSDLLDILRIAWNEKLRTAKSINKKDYEIMNKLFQQVYMDYVYPLTKLNNLPSTNLARVNLEQTRFNMINEFIQKSKQDKLSVLLSDEYEYTPLTFEELDFNAIYRYS